jgi:hypothetical protein
MAVSSIILSSAGLGGDSGLAYSAGYRVSCDDPGDDPSIVLRYFETHAGLPWKGRPYRFGNGFDYQSVCKSVKADYIENSGGKFIVNASFEASSGGDEQQPQSGTDVKGKETKDPTKWHDEIEFTFTNLTVAAEKGIFRKYINGSGKFPIDKERALTDSAGVPFTAEKNLSIRVLRLTRQKKKCDAANGDKYIDAVNNDTFTIKKPSYGFSYKVGKYQALCKQWSAAFAIENGFKFWRETIELHINPMGWRREYLDRGFHRRLQYSGGTPDYYDSGVAVTYPESIAAGFVPYTKILQKDGTPLSEPVPLDGNGKVLAADKPHVYLVYSIENELPFGKLKW